MSTDLSLFTKEKNKNLNDCFSQYLKNAEALDCILTCFHIKNFHYLIPALKGCKNIRIITGIADMPSFPMNKASQSKVLKIVEKNIIKVMNTIQEDREIENGVKTLLKWIYSGKVNIRAYSQRPVNTNLYIIKPGMRNPGPAKVISGSSNFTQQIFDEITEINLMLNNAKDQKYLKEKFEVLWDNSVDINRVLPEALVFKTWIRSDIKPFHLYLKFLAEYFAEELCGLGPNSNSISYLPSIYNLEYIKHFIISAKKIILQYGGVFISEVAGTSKYLTAAMLTGQLDGRTLVLSGKNLSGSWERVFNKINLNADIESLTAINNVSPSNYNEHNNIIIDDFITFNGLSKRVYEKIRKICDGKRLIFIVSNYEKKTPCEILKMVSLFQKPQNSIIPNLMNIEAYLTSQEKKLKTAARKNSYANFIAFFNDTYFDINERLLKHLTMSRTTKDIRGFFSKDLKKAGLPVIQRPVLLYYGLGENGDEAFCKTIKLIADGIKYSLYTPLFYYKDKINKNEELAQRNLVGNLKSFLLKLLERDISSFKKTISRIIDAHKNFLLNFDAGIIYAYKKITINQQQYREFDHVEEILKESKTCKFNAEDFVPRLKEDYFSDLQAFQSIEKLWRDSNSDLKIQRLKAELSQNSLLKDGKIIIYTASDAMAEYIFENIEKTYTDEEVILYTSDSDRSVFCNCKQMPRIFITSDALPESIDLYWADIIINYDIPWNMAKHLLRHDRVRRIGNKNKCLHSFYLLPGTKVDDENENKNAFAFKVKLIFNALGHDAEYLVKGSPSGPKEIISRLYLKNYFEKAVFAEDKGLKYFHKIKSVKDNDPDLFLLVRNLPDKSRSAITSGPGSLITYYKVGHMHKFFMSGESFNTEELDFLTTAKMLEGHSSKNPVIHFPDIYDFLYKNNDALNNSVLKERHPSQKLSEDTQKLLNIIFHIFRDGKRLNKEQDRYLMDLVECLECQLLPENLVRSALNAVEHVRTVNPLQVFLALRFVVSDNLFDKFHDYTHGNDNLQSKMVLSMFL